MYAFTAPSDEWLSSESHLWKQSSLFRLSLNEHRFKCSLMILDLKEMAAFSAVYFYALVVLVHRKIRNNSYSKNKQFFWESCILTVLNFKCAAVEPRSLNRNGTRSKISMCQCGDTDRICMSPGTACMLWKEAVRWLLFASPIFLKAPQAAPPLICKLSVSSSLRGRGALGTFQTSLLFLSIQVSSLPADLLCIPQVFTWSHSHFSTCLTFPCALEGGFAEILQWVRQVLSFIVARFSFQVGAGLCGWLNGSVR